MPNRKGTDLIENVRLTEDAQGTFKLDMVESFAQEGSFSAHRMELTTSGRLASAYPHDMDIGIVPVPVRRDVLEDQPKLALVARPERSGGDRLSVDVWFARADQGERKRFNLRAQGLVVAEEHLDGHGHDRARAGVVNVAVDKG